MDKIRVKQNEVKSACPYCGVGCGVAIQGKKIVGDEQHPTNRGALCVKGSALAESMKMPSRLLYPKIKGTETDWENAVEHISQQIADTIDRHGPDAVAFYLSGQILTEDYYVANKLMKGWVGSANVDTNSRLCMSSAVAAHIRAFGEDLVPVNYDDLSNTDLLIITGNNTAWTHPIIFRRIQQARELNPDFRLVVIDPKRTVTAEQADLHIPVPSDGDVFLYNALMAYCISTSRIDEAYIASHTNGWNELKKELSKSKYLPDAASDYLNIDLSVLMTFFRWFSESDKVISMFCQGYNQSAYGTDKGNALINAHLITGKIGKEGSGPFSITGQPNAMGGREVGGLANQLAVHRGFDAGSVSQVADFWGAPNMATGPGLKAVDMFDAIDRGEIKFLWVMSTNPAVSMPDADKVRRAMEKCDCVVVSDITADTDTATYADILLPAAGWGEKEGMVTNSERLMTRQRKFMTPPGLAIPDWQALALVGSRLSEILGVADGFNYQSAADVFREYAGLTGINRGTPFRLEISELAGMTDEDYAGWQPQQWPLNKADSPLSQHNYPTNDGKANLIATETPDILNKSHWWLNTGRQRDQWHTMTRTGHIHHLAASEPEPTVYMSTLSSEHAGIPEGGLIELTAPESESKVVARLAIDEGLTFKQVFMSMHWAGIYSGLSQANRVINDSTDPVSGQPAYKSSLVDVKAADIADYAVFVGRDIPQADWCYRVCQRGEENKIWRLASGQSVAKTLVRTKPGKKRLILDQKKGWVSVECSVDPLSGKIELIEGILFVSSGPVEISGEKIAGLVGKPFVLSTLLETLNSSGVADKLVCSCFRVTEQQIMDAIQEQGCVSLSQLQSELKCGTNCGSCIPEVERYLSPEKESDLQIGSGLF